jgi:inorganic triphosphatase YgiF
MSEQELKLHVPKHAKLGVQNALHRGAVSTLRLRAQYLDTDNADLAKAGVALRLRQEGRRWVQTLKMPGAHRLEKIELNAPRPGPTLDLSVYDGTPAERLINKHKSALGVVYQTDVRRVFRRIRTSAGVVEVALDQGQILAGALSLPVSEIEFELVSGQPHAIFLLGLKWLNTHNLVLDLRSKAERGTELATLAKRLSSLDQTNDTSTQAMRARAIARFWQPRATGTIALRNDMSCQQALSAVTNECIDQIARNAAVLAEIDTTGLYQAANPEHTHQLRVGMRRLRSAWSLFQQLAVLPPEAWRQDLKRHFAALGTARDDDVLRDTVLPALKTAGQPALTLAPNPVNGSSKELAASATFQGWLVELLAWSIGAHPQQIGPDAPPETVHQNRPTQRGLGNLLSKRLYKWHQAVLAEGLQFDKLPIEAQHSLRKRAKRLRYGLQFSETLLPAKKLRGYRRELSEIQDILGEMNDLYVARETFEAIRDDQPPAWFAVGWIAARLNTLTNQAQTAFKRLKQADHFWD